MRWSMIKFGPSGTGSIFEEEGFSKTIDVPNWLKGKGLDLYEYSFGRSEERRVGKEC